MNTLRKEWVKFRIIKSKCNPHTRVLVQLYPEICKQPDPYCFSSTFYSRVAQAYVNQRKLDHEVKTLQVQASQFSKQTAQWISMVEGFNQALKVRSTG